MFAFEFFDINSIYLMPFVVLHRHTRTHTLTLLSMHIHISSKTAALRAGTTIRQ